MNPPGGFPAPGPGRNRSETVLETDDDLRQALLQHARAYNNPALAAGQAPPPQTAPYPTAQTSPPAAALAPAQPPQPRPATPPERLAEPFRPSARPPIPILTVLDDGRLEGEQIRIRDFRFLIGRTEGDLRFPVDSRMSSKHVEIACRQVGGSMRWFITDLKSTNGMFVKVVRTYLADGAEVLIGSGRYRFEAGGSADATVNLPESSKTVGYSGTVGLLRLATFSELLGAEIGPPISLAKPEYWIGADSNCEVRRPSDPYCESRHARLYREPDGRWQIENHRSFNGIWLACLKCAWIR